MLDIHNKNKWVTQMANGKWLLGTKQHACTHWRRQKKVVIAEVKAPAQRRRQHCCMCIGHQRTTFSVARVTAQQSTTHTATRHGMAWQCVNTWNNALLPYFNFCGLSSVVVSSSSACTACICCSYLCIYCCSARVSDGLFICLWIFIVAVVVFMFWYFFHTLRVEFSVLYGFLWFVYVRCIYIRMFVYVWHCACRCRRLCPFWWFVCVLEFSAFVYILHQCDFEFFFQHLFCIFCFCIICAHFVDSL